MAGAGFKTFTVGEVLTSSDVNTYLMQQAVMNFASSGARGSAIGTATEGMVSYLADTDTVEVYDGSAWTAVGAAGIGSNIVSVTKTDPYTMSSSSFAAVTGLSVTITPTSSASKVLVIASLNGATQNGAANSLGNFRLTRGGTAIAVGDAAGTRTQTTTGLSTRSTNTSLLMAAVAVTLDSPATTSATTYAVEAMSVVGTLYVNRTETDADGFQRPRSVSSLTAIEVAA